HVKPQPVLHGLERNIAQGMIDKMTDQIGKKNYAAGQADLPHSDPAQEIAWPNSYRGSVQARLSSSPQISCLCRRKPPTASLRHLVGRLAARGIERSTSDRRIAHLR